MQPFYCGTDLHACSEKSRRAIWENGMERIDEPRMAEEKVLRDMRKVILKLRELVAQDLNNVQEGSGKLRDIRSAVSEDLNQIQHEYLILRGLEWLIAKEFGPEMEWEWNPRQTGSGNEPDLRGSANGKIVVSAEASASEKPVGTIDSRIKETLEKLSRMEGEKFYFVCTHLMAQRARTKVDKARCPIKVVQV
jgi:hypothetical protein